MPWSSYWMVISLPEQLVAWGPVLAPSHSQQMASGTGGWFCCLGLACRPAAAAKGFPGQGEWWVSRSSELSLLFGEQKCTQEMLKSYPVV